MDIFEEGIRRFFSWFLGGVKQHLEYTLEVKTGQKLPRLEFSNLKELTRAIENGEIVGEQDVKIKNVCLSNFAPLYLCYDKTFDEISESIKSEAEEARKLYQQLRKKYKIPDSVSLFLEAARGKLKIDTLFREYADAKKFRFLGLSLARFGSITSNVCYGALFEAGAKLQNHTSPLADDVGLEPFMPFFYDTSIPVIQSHSYVDVEIIGKAMILPAEWMDILKQRGMQTFERPYCIYVPRIESYSISVTGLETWMSLDAWINFSVPSKNLNLPFFHRFDPNDEKSRKLVCEDFREIYNELNSISPTDVTFYSDYVQPFVKKVKPTLDMETLRRLVAG